MTITNTTLEPEYSGDKRPRLPVIGASGTTQENGNYTPTANVDFPGMGKELFISNDSANTLTFTITTVNGTLSFMLLPGETFNEAVSPFTSVAVTVTGLWRWYVRGNIA